MAGLGVAPHVIEAVLNHQSGTIRGIARVYNRYNYSNEKRSALERWSAHIEGLVEGRPAKVVALDDRRAAPDG